MKLIGSKTEQDFREDLMKSHKSLFQDESKHRLLGILKTYFHDFKTAYVIEHIQEQGEDIYTVLINFDFVAQIELDRFNLEEKPLINALSINNYKQGLSKLGQIKLSVAIDLARRELKI